MAEKKIHRVKSILEFHKLKGLPAPQHPLISLFDYGKVACSNEVDHENFVFDFYHISIKRSIGARFKYGQNHYDFDDGVMFFIAPNQVFGIEQIAAMASPKSGWILMIHPDFFWNTSLAKNIKRFAFFDYAVNEALYLSEREEETLNGIVRNIEVEYHTNLDNYSHDIIISQIETLLNYSERFYHRQFLTRSKNSHEILSKVEIILNDYFNDESRSSKSLPSVQYLADLLHISPVYLTSLLKSLTGQSAKQIIHEKLIEKAKEELSTTRLTVSEIAYNLGYEHSQSFSKLFKKKSGFSPSEFRESFN